jgi:acyl dehydratase
MNYAAAVGEANPLYFDDEAAGGIIAPPMYAVAFTWPVMGNIWDFIEAEDFPREVLMTMVHHTEHLTFHGAIRPGETLELNGRVAAIMPHRAGTVAILRLDATGGDGKPVFTEHIGAMLRGVDCIGGAKGTEDLPPDTFVKACETPAWEETIRIDPLAPYIYDGCSDIHFPIHTSRAFARQVGLPGIIHQGTATLALAVREFVNREAGSDPRRLKSVSCRFSGMVTPGSEIRVRLLSRAEGGLRFFEVLNASGQKAISRGAAVISV